jgi:uncharacterized protein
MLRFADLSIAALLSIIVLQVSGFALRNQIGMIRNEVRMSTTSDSDPILRRVDKWACVKGCGACCKLGPLDSRPDLPEYLSAEELELYKSMIGPDDWCINYDKEKRLCKIYETRPTFCTVDPKKFTKMFGIEEAEMNVSVAPELNRLQFMRWTTVHFNNLSHIHCKSIHPCVLDRISASSAVRSRSRMCTARTPRRWSASRSSSRASRLK